MTRLPPSRTLWYLLPADDRPGDLPRDDLQRLVLDGPRQALARIPAAGPPVALPESFPADSVIDPPAAGDPGEPLVLLRPVHAPAGTTSDAAAAAVLLVSGVAPSSSPLTVNGVPVGPGLHVLRHGDHIARGGLSLWLSADHAAEPSTYDPSVDGGHVFCARTKLRLQAGDAIVRCPGTPTQGCDLVFRASTWGSDLRCHQCGHDPSAPRWMPSVSRAAGSSTSRLHRLLRHASLA